MVWSCGPGSTYKIEKPPNGQRITVRADLSTAKMSHSATLNEEAINKKLFFSPPTSFLLICIYLYLSLLGIHVKADTS